MEEEEEESSSEEETTVTTRVFCRRVILKVCDLCCAMCAVQCGAFDGVIHFATRRYEFVACG